jgi:2-phosphosulfolactate phosphatase
MPTVHAYPLFSHASPESFRGRCVVVVDLLRAGTTITRALESGATDVRLFLEPQDAIAARSLLAPAPCVLGGERGGILIPGFDLDNSPASYTPARVRGTHVLFTTTNGTRAALFAASAAVVYFGCFNNLPALARTVIESGLETHILCAGTNGLISQEDCLFAGALIDRLLSAGMSLGADDGALLMRTLWAANPDPSSLRASTLAANGGRNLVHLGFTEDIDDCLRIGTTELVPRFDPATTLVTAASSLSHVSGASA